MGEQRRRRALQTVANEPLNSQRPWVLAVVAFWISAGITLAVLLSTGKLNLILVGTTFGTMVLGVWLKIRYQRQRTKAGDRTSGAKGASP